VRHGATRAALTLCAALTLAACSSGGGTPTTPPSTSQTTPAARPSSTAKLALIAPKDGEVFKAGTIPVKVSLQDAKITPVVTTNLKPNLGHLHLYLDGQIVSMNYQLTDTLHDVKPGLHVLRVEFVAQDHAPFDPRVVVTVSFTVSG